MARRDIKFRQFLAMNIFVAHFKVTGAVDLENFRIY